MIASRFIGVAALNQGRRLMLGYSGFEEVLDRLRCRRHCCEGSEVVVNCRILGHLKGVDSSGDSQVLLREVRVGGQLS